MLLVTASICVAPLGCKRATVAQLEDESAKASRHNGNGRQWLAWNSYDRDDFVSAYIDGYNSGVHDGCAATDHLLDLKPGRTYQHDKDEIVLPSGVCRKGSPHYSGDVMARTGTLTKFYSAHPEYQDIPFEYLMPYLTDEQNKTADDLFKMAKAGEMRTSW